MNRVLVLFTFAGFLNSCTHVPPITGSVVTDLGEFRIHPDGRIEVVVESKSTK